MYDSAWYKENELIAEVGEKKANFVLPWAPEAR